MDSVDLQHLPAVALIIIGTIVCFFGKRLFKPALAITGFIGGAVAGHLLSATLVEQKLIEESQLMYRAIVIGSAFLCAVLSLVLFRVAGYVVCVGGSLLAYQVLVDTISASRYVDKIPVAALYLTASLFVIVGVLLVRFVERLAICLMTSLAGSGLATYGADMILQKGFLESMHKAWDTKSAIRAMESIKGDASAEGDVGIMFAAFVGLTAAGTIVQLKLCGRDRKN